MCDDQPMAVRAVFWNPDTWPSFPGVPLLGHVSQLELPEIIDVLDPPLYNA